jgi:hypothetical protein
MRTYILAILLIFLSNFALAAEVMIVDVRRNIPLSDDEPAYKDFYINAGSEDGMKKNLVVNVVRPLNVRDASGAQSFGEILIPVAQVRILAVYPHLSVAREYKMLSRDENPMLEQVAIMNGDRVEIKNSFVDAKPVTRKPQTVVEATPQAVPAIAVPVVAAVVATPVEPAAKLADEKPLPVPGEVAKSAKVEAPAPTAAAPVQTPEMPANPVNNTATPQPLPVTKTTN